MTLQSVTTTDRPLEAEAFELAMREVAAAHPEAATTQYVADVAMDSVLALAKAGQSDVSSLARYATSRALAYRVKRWPLA